MTVHLGHILVVFTLAGCAICATEDHVVETDVGTVAGFKHDVDIFGKTIKVSRFLGIPYAEAPVGDLRFQKPVPKAAFTSPFIAKQHGNICFQQHLFPTAKVIRNSEDCLFLNIYAPATAVNGGLPVMIWIHGGGFVAGSADFYASDTLAGFGDVIVVTFNYRLSIWGFFTTGKDDGPLNVGLWDQHLAIKWVHDNIGAFGGDTNRVTIFGESAGSASVVHQCLFERNSGLFQRAIGQSGSVTAPWASTTSYRDSAEKVGRLVGCNDPDPEKLYGCIASTPAELLNSTLNNATNGFMMFWFSFVPVSDGEFFKYQKSEMFSTHSSTGKHELFSSLDFIAGMTSAEGAGVVVFETSDPDNFLPNRTYFEEIIVPKYVEFALGPDIPESVTLAAIGQYTTWSDPENPERIREGLVRLFSDIFMTANIMETVNFHASQSSESARTYLYQFDVNPSYHLSPTPSWLGKANHADELIYQFGYGDDGIMSALPEENPTLKDWELQLSKDMLTMWSNFAKTGDPNQPNSVGHNWPQYNLATQTNFDINGDISPNAEKQYQFANTANFWNKLIPSLMKVAKEGAEDHGRLSSKHQDTCHKDEHCSP